MTNLFFTFRYKWLDKTFVGTARSVIVKKVMLDQLLFTPPLYAVFYISKQINKLVSLDPKVNKSIQSISSLKLGSQ